MIKKNDETGKDPKKISSFKKFSEMTSTSKPKDNNSEMSEDTFDEDDLPAFPNLPSKSEKVEKTFKNDYMMPNGQNTEPNKNENVKFYGKVAKLPKGVKASKGYNFLENVKVSKSSIWYIMVEKSSNELQMVKYNNKKGVDVSKFINDLKKYYTDQYSDNKKIVKLIEAIQIDGNDKYSRICNIPLVEVDGKKIITKITEDLIKLLSK